MLGLLFPSLLKEGGTDRQRRFIQVRGIVDPVRSGRVHSLPLHPGGSWERRLKNDPATTVAFVQREIPFGRFGTAEEIGDVIAFLLSPRASWIAGSCVVVDGGQSRSF